MNETVDNQETSDLDNLDTTTTETQSTEQPLTQQAPVQEPYKPFASGKEKFKVNGQEQEWDWETTKKYASLGNTAYKKLEEAAELKKKNEATYKQLLELAQKDPEGLIRALNPNYSPQAFGNQQAQTQSGQVTDTDPRDLKIRELEQRYSELSSTLEKQQIEEERKVIAKEMDDAVSKYSNLKDNKYALNYLKSEYAKALRNGMDVTIEDVAFYISRDLEEQQKQQVQSQQKRIVEKRKAAPVSMHASGSDTGDKPMTLDDVKRLAGRL